MLIAMKNKKILPYVLGVVVVLVIASIFLVNNMSGPRVPEKKDNNTLIIGTTDSGTTLDPANAYDYFSNEIQYNTVDGLVRYKLGSSQLVSGLAKDWNINKGGKTYTFNLREGLKFHNGKELTAKDVKFSIERARDLEGLPGFLMANVDNVEVVSETEVKIHLKEASIPFLSKLAYTVGAILPSESYPKDEFQPENLIASGPYKLENWKKGKEVLLKKNKNYWGKEPWAEEVKVKIYNKSSNLKKALEDGKINIAYRTFKPSEKQSLRENENIKTKDFTSPSIRYIVLNMKEEPFNNANVRKALAYAVDRNELNKKVYSGERAPLYSMVPNKMWSHKAVFKKKYGEGQNIEKAKKKLSEAGYSESNKLEITLWYTPKHYGDLESDLASNLEKQLEETGIFKVKPKSLTWKKYIGNMSAGNFNIHLLGWYPDYFDPDDYLAPFLTPKGATTFSSYYNNSKMTELINEEKSIVDQEKRTQKFEEIQDLLAEDAPYIPLVQGKQFAAFQSSVKKDSVKLGPVQIFRYYTIRKENWKR